MQTNLRKLVVGAALVLTAAILISCALFPQVTPDDAGHAAFMRQAVPVLHGRKIRGHAEVKLLSDLADETSRETVLRALMEQPEFIDEWSEVLVDDLRIDREGAMAQTSCYGNPRRAGTPTEALAMHILNNTPTAAAGGGAFNMSDVVRSALVADNLFPAFKAHLYPHVNRPPISSNELSQRDGLGAKFAETYINRQMGCLTCHNSEFSASGASSNWNRTFPIRGLMEKSIFGVSTGEPTRNAYAMFRTDARFGGTLAPWGMLDCGTTYRTANPVDPQNVQAHWITWRGQSFGVHQLQNVFQQSYQALKADGIKRLLPAGLQAQCDFCSDNCAGDVVDITAAANAAPNAAQVHALLNNRCSSCHGGAAGLDIPLGADWANDTINQSSSQKPGATRVVPGMANSSYLYQKITNAGGIVGNQMPPSGTALTATEKNQVRDWINGLPMLSACNTCSTLDCRQIPQEVQGEDAFAFLTAANIVDNTWQEVFGGPLTIDNYFPRTFAQRQALWNVTEYNFVPNDWSLRDVLAQIMTSSFFSRQPPSTSTHSTAYDLPLVFDPWVEADPRVPPVSDPGYDANAHPQDHKNAMSDGVYRYSARSLTNSVHTALAWTQPQRFPGANYPTEDLMRAIGFYFSQEQPGFQVSDFQGLLNWESVHGVCEKPTGVAVDWVDRLMTAIAAFTPPSGEGPLTAGDVAVVMRDWLLGYGELMTATPQGLSGSEADVVRTLFGVISLDAPVSGIADLEARLRRLCGVQLQSPQFQLAGIVDNSLGPKPRLRVCNTAGDCTYKQMCERIAPAVRKIVGGSNTVVICGDDNVNVVELPDFDGWVEVEVFCPPALCGRLIKWLPDIYINPPVLQGEQVKALSLEKQMPSCSPEVAREGLGACGIPSLGKTLDRGDTLIAALEGARVQSAKSVRLLKRDATRFVPLEADYRLGRGDLIVIAADGALKVETKAGRTLQTTRKNTPKNKAAVLPIVVWAPTVDAKLDSMLAAQNPKLPQDKIHRIMFSERAIRGEAGIMLEREDYKDFKYSPEELDTKRLRERGLLPEQLQGKKR